MIGTLAAYNYLEVCVSSMAKNGSSVSVTWSVKNLTEQKINLDTFNTYVFAALIDSAGQVSTARPSEEEFLAPHGMAQVSAGFTFAKQVEGKNFYFIYLLSVPYLTGPRRVVRLEC